MAARRKKPVRKTEWKPWEEAYVRGFGVPDGWTTPSRVKVVTGAKSGTMTAQLKDEGGQPVEAFIRFRAERGEWIIIDSGLRMTWSFKVKGGAK